MKNFIKKSICILLVGLFLFSVNAFAVQINDETKTNNLKTTSSTKLTQEVLGSDPVPDIDPLVDLEVKVTIKEIRAYDKIDRFSDPDFYVKVFIDGEEYRSETWKNQKQVNADWSVTADVDDYQENVTIRIELWDWNIGLDKKCDISKDEFDFLSEKHVDLLYNLNTSHWTGGDFIDPEPVDFDESGYGRLSGCDDNSIYRIDNYYEINDSIYLDDNDCEIIFDITQNDYDSDGIPYWTEVHQYGTDPMIDDRGRDDDNDGVPIEWEFKWGTFIYYSSWYGHQWNYYYFYDPFKWENHSDFDPDQDGLDNIEEYLTSQWDSDPYRRDLFLEVDQMEIGPNGEGGPIPEKTKELMRDAYEKRNIVFHFDDGWMGGGQNDIPFDESTSYSELQYIYYKYFLNEDYDNWRQGVFRYAIIPYDCSDHPGFVFWGGDENFYHGDSFQISTKFHDTRIFQFRLVNIITVGKIKREERRAIVYASGMMHETGHTLGIHRGNTPGCDNPYTYVPWQKNWFKYRNYKSCMNYRYVYRLVDYSDGRYGKNDWDDWNRIDLTYFQREPYWE